MSDKQPGPVNPASPQPHPGTADPRGSIAAGIGLAILIQVGGNMLVPMLGMLFGRVIPDNDLSILWLLLPQAVFVVAVVLAYAKGKTRTGHGLLLGLAAILALILLLVAACFGLVALNH